MFWNEKCIIQSPNGLSIFLFKSIISIFLSQFCHAKYSGKKKEKKSLNPKRNEKMLKDMRSNIREEYHVIYCWYQQNYYNGN